MNSRCVIPSKWGQVHFCNKASTLSLIENWSDPKPKGINASFCINFRGFWIQASIIPVVRAHCLISVRENFLISFFRIKKKITRPNVSCVHFLMKIFFTGYFANRIVELWHIFKILSMKRNARNEQPQNLHLMLWKLPRMRGGEKIKKPDIILLSSKKFDYCSLLLPWHIMSLYTILQAYPFIISYTEFP